MPNEKLTPLRAWRMILVTAAAAAMCWLASVMLLRALAQQAPSVTPPDTNEVEAEPRRSAPPTLSDDESPEYRDSADNNISLPVDI